MDIAKLMYRDGLMDGQRILVTGGGTGLGREMTEAFGVPLAIDSKIRDGSLRQCAADMGVPVILYEAGEALRFEEMHIRAGVRVIINVMRNIGMLRKTHRRKPMAPPIISDKTSWVRAPESGILRTLVPLGAQVSRGQTLAVVADPLGERHGWPSHGGGGGGSGAGGSVLD